MTKLRKYLPHPVAVIIAITSSLLFIFRDLEYDEIWSLENYSKLTIGEIFSDLATPNNHPLNSLLIKILWFSKDDFWSIRLGSVIFFAGSALLLSVLGKMFYRQRGAWYGALAAGLPPVIVAGSTARGYAGQLFLLLLCGLALLKCRKGSIFWTIIAVFAGIPAALALPSSALYLFPMGIFFIIYLIKKRKFPPVQIAIFSLAALIGGCWYGMNWQDFAQSSQFKVPIDSFRSFLEWFDEALSFNAVPFWLLPVVCFLKRKRKITWILLTLMMFPLAAAIFTQPAPARVYLPGFAAGVLMMVPDFRNKKFNIAAFVLFLMLQFAVSMPVFPDDKVVNDLISFRDASGVINVYGAHTGYPIRWNHPECIGVFYRQIQKAATLPQCVLALESSQLSGVTADGRTLVWELPTTPGNLPENEPFLLNLTRTDTISPGMTGFALIPPVPEATFFGNIRFLQASEMIFLNSWLTQPLNAPDGSVHRFALVAFKVKSIRNFPKEAPIFHIAIEK